MRLTTIIGQHFMRLPKSTRSKLFGYCLTMVLI